MKEKNKAIISATVVIIVIAALSIFVLFSDEAKQFNTSTFEVQAEHDDGRSFRAANSEVGYGDENGAWATLQLASTYSFGIRFTNVTIPADAEIVDVYVELYSTGSLEILRTPNCNIYCDKVLNPVNFTTMGVLDICGRNYTNNYTLWNTTLPYGEYVKTPSIAPVIREIINQQNWTAGNPIVVLFDTNQLNDYQATFDNYEHGHPARLIIKWK